MKPDIQICNHNYLLADAAHRQQDRPLLLRSYQALVVDEAHKLPDAAARCTRNPCQNAKCKSFAYFCGKRTILTLPRTCARRSGHWF